MSKRIYLRDYDWITIQPYYDEDRSWRDITTKFGITHSSLSRAVKQGLFKTRTVGEGVSISQKLSPRTYSDDLRNTMSVHAKRRGLGGTRNSNKFWYTRLDGSKVRLDSSYELAVATELDLNGIDWERPKRLPWVDENGVSHTYTADFYLPRYNMYLDPKHKGIIDPHAPKIAKVCEQNRVQVIVLTKEQLTWEAIKKLIDERTNTS